MEDYIGTIIILAIVMIIISYNYSQKRKIERSPFLIIKRKLEEDLMQANFSGDWRKRQKINLELHWMNNVLAVEKMKAKSFSNNFEEPKEDIYFYDKLKESDLIFPQKWKLNDIYCYPFARKILSIYGEELINLKGNQGIYYPENKLPIPKGYIIKAYYYITDYLKLDKPYYDVKDKVNLQQSLTTILIYLKSFVINTGDVDLPKTSPDNVLIASEFKKGNEQILAIEDWNYIDWRTVSDWLNVGKEYLEHKNYDYALECCRYAERIDFNNEEIIELKGIIKFERGKELFNIGDHYGAIICWKESASYNNVTAQNLLSDLDKNLKAGLMF